MGSVRYHSLDFWRGVACLLVVVFHSTFYVAENPQRNDVGVPYDQIVWLWTQMKHGVPMFFVISGYCITAAAISIQARRDSSKQYYFRRFRRIFPPLWCFLAIFLPIVSIADVLRPGIYSDAIHGILRPWWIPPWSWLGSVTLTETWRLHLVRWISATPVSADSKQEFLLFFGHMWTLCYEEQFYIVMGLALLVFRRHIFQGLGIVSLAVLAIIWMTPQSQIQGFFFDGLWLQFAAGVAVYYAIHRASPGQRIATLFGLIAVTVFLGRLIPEGYVETSYYVAFAFATLLILLHPLDQQQHLLKARWSAPISNCGKMCYSLYLVHWPVVKPISHLLHDWGVTSVVGTCWITIPICILTSILVAAPFHYWIERRFMNPPAQPVSLSES